MDWTDDRGQVFIVRDRLECSGVNHPELVASMLAEAQTENLEPSDFTPLGYPIIFLRGLYCMDEGTRRWQKDFYVMPVREKR